MARLNEFCSARFVSNACLRLRLIACSIVLALTFTVSAAAQMIVVISGTSGSGETIFSVSGTLTPTLGDGTSPRTTDVVENGDSPDFLDTLTTTGEPYLNGVSASGGCSDSDETRAFDAGNSLLADLGPTQDLFQLSLEDNIAFKANDTISCDGAVTFPVDIQYIRRTNLSIEIPPATGRNLAGEIIIRMGN